MQPEHAFSVLRFLTGSVEREHATTARVLAAVPLQNTDYRPDPKSKTAMDLAWHVASSEQFFLTGIANGQFPEGGAPRPESIKTPADVATWYKEQFEKNFERVKGMNADEAARIVNFRNFAQLPAVAFLQFMITHSAHHRGQLSAYLRPMGGKVPSIYGPSGDEEPMPATAQAKG